MDGATPTPCRAVVTPRCLSADGNDVLPVEERIVSLLYRGVRGVVNLCGRGGSGKTTALAHLASVLSDAPIQLFDDVSGEMAWAQIHHISRHGLAIVSSREKGMRSCIAHLAMAPWTNDDLIEYLLARHREKCQAILFKVSTYAQHLPLDGSPELWRMVLDAMAADESIQDVSTALRRCIAPVLSDPRPDVADIALWALRKNLGDHVQLLARLGEPNRRLLRHRAVQLILASERIVRDLCDGVRLPDIQEKLPHDLILETARLAAHWPAAIERLTTIVAGRKRRFHPMAVTLLLAMQPQWRPEDKVIPLLSGAYVAGAHWAGVDLHGASLAAADLDHADLSNANLANARAESAMLRGASLRGAMLNGLDGCKSNLAEAQLAGASADGAKLLNADLHAADLHNASLNGVDFTGADLSDAILTGANLREATLEATDLEGADLVGADLTWAKLNGVRLSDVNVADTRFNHANLKACDLEGLSLPEAKFAAAKLCGCYLTATFMPHADFRGADLRGTGLADIDWEHADLRDADLRGATFHMGSTRSGLVGSVIPSEGSKTGFYTDDFNDREFKDAAQIRKANLRGADLRGAQIDGVDFYLVDLRDAMYSEDQAEHFKKCGAILD